MDRRISASSSGQNTDMQTGFAAFSPVVADSPFEHNRDYDDSGDWGSQYNGNAQFQHCLNWHDQHNYDRDFQPHNSAYTDQASSATIEEILQLFNANMITLEKNATTLKELEKSVSIITSQLKQEGYDLPRFQQEALATPQQPSLLVKETTSVENLLSGLTKMIESRFDYIEAGMQKQQTMMDMLSGSVSTLTDLVATLDRK
ncbi:hypothetical protein LINGRAHAP2_LOCUS7816, partial [Linum grandiflorum]